MQAPNPSEPSSDLFLQHFPQANERSILLVVIHAKSIEQIADNIRKAQEAGVDGVFLINHGVSYKVLLQWTEEISVLFPNVWVGLNMLPLSALAEFEELPTSLFSYVKGIWADDANINESTPHDQPYPSRVLEQIYKRRYPGLYFGGVSFKYQRQVGVNASASAAKIARKYMHVITTSGAGTGKPPEVDKIAKMRIGAGQTPLAIASGITAENIRDYIVHGVACYLVATGVSDNFHELNLDKMIELATIIRTSSASSSSSSSSALADQVPK